MRVIILGDVVGKPGRDVLRDSLRQLRDSLEAEFVVANVETAAGALVLISMSVMSYRLGSVLYFVDNTWKVSTKRPGA